MTVNVRARPVLYAMCGLAFSGKSTLARRISDAVGAPIVSLDAINRERGLDGGRAGSMSDAQWEETSRLAVERIAGLMRGGGPVVLDDTLSHRFLRDRYRLVAAGQGYEFVLIYVDTPLSLIEARRRANDCTGERASIEDEVFAQHPGWFEPPDDDEACARRPGIAGAAEEPVLLWLPSGIAN